MRDKKSVSVTLQDDLRKWITKQSDATGVSVSGLIGLYIYEKMQASYRVPLVPVGKFEGLDKPIEWKS